MVLEAAISAPVSSGRWRGEIEIEMPERGIPRTPRVSSLPVDGRSFILDRVMKSGCGSGDL